MPFYLYRFLFNGWMLVEKGYNLNKPSRLILYSFQTVVLGFSKQYCCKI